MHWAAIVGHEAVVRVLVEAGANKDATNEVQASNVRGRGQGGGEGREGRKRGGGWVEMAACGAREDACACMCACASVRRWYSVCIVVLLQLLILLLPLSIQPIVLLHHLLQATVIGLVILPLRLLLRLIPLVVAA